MSKLLLLFMLTFSFSFSQNISFLTQEEEQYLINKKVLKICMESNWFPFEKFDDNGKYKGISSEYFKLFAQQLNITVKPIKTLNKSQSLEFAKNKKCDILTLISETPEGKKYLNFTKSHLNIPIVMVTKNNIDFIYDFRTLKGKKVGVIKNSTTSKMLKVKYPNLILVDVDNDKNGIYKVQSNDLFGYVGNILSINDRLKSNFITNLKIINRLDNEQLKLSVGVRNDDIVLSSIFNKMISNISNDTKQSIIDKYITVKYVNEVKFMYLKYIIPTVISIILIFLYIQYKLKQQNKILEIRVKEEIDKNRKKEQLYLTQSKLAQMGELLSMIAHQWRQPLSAINATISYLKYNIQLEEFHKDKFLKELDDVENFTQILTNTISDFKKFYKPNKSATTVVVNETINKALYIIKHSLEYDKISIIYNYNSTKKVKIYENELMQVFLNIIKNAQDKFKEQENKEKIIKIITQDTNNSVLIQI